MGNKATYIENGMSDTIWVKCDTDRASVEMSNFEAEENDSAVYIGDGVGLRGEQSNSWPKIRREFTPIAQQDFKKFTFFDKDRSTIYLTIIAANGEIIANALAKPKGIYFVVKERDTTKPVKPLYNYNQQPMPPTSKPRAVWTGSPAKPAGMHWIPTKREVTQWVSRSERLGGGYWVRWIWTPEQGWRSYPQMKRWTSNPQMHVPRSTSYPQLQRGTSYQNLQRPYGRRTSHFK